jgi:hypothetical protein
MPVDVENIKKVLDDFENDKYSEAEDLLRKEVAKHRDEWLNKKLELKSETEEDDDVDDDDVDADKDDPDVDEE